MNFVKSRILFFLLAFGSLSSPFIARCQYSDRYAAHWTVEDTSSVAHKLYSDPFVDSNEKSWLHRFTTSPAFQISYVPVGLFALAGVSANSDDYVRAARNFNIPAFRYHYDDYFQYAPGVLTFALKAFGVEGRSSWGRLVTSTAFSGAIMATTVNSLKYGVARNRPDNSGKNSFPSGHTSMAFMVATWLHKEYGVTRSPLYSIFGYATATGIGISRVMNNKHWLSDVLTGAGVGILSSNVGYYLGDLMYGDRGISSRAISQSLPPSDFHPSFWNLSSGYSLLNNYIELSEQTVIKVNPGFYIGTEGAYFITPNVGFGGKISVNTNTLDVNKSEFLSNRPDFENLVDHVEPGATSVYSIFVGPYFSLPLSRRLYLNYKVISGYSCSTSSEIIFVKKLQQNQKEPERVVGYKSKSDHHMGLETGVSFVTMVSRNMGLKFFTDYSISTSRPNYAQIKDINSGVPTYSDFVKSDDATQNVIIGIGINAYFH